MSGPEPLRPLRPFTPQPLLEAFSLEAAAGWDGARLQLLFRLQGPLQQLRLPPPSAKPQRCDGLWQSSCFEAFVAVRGHRGYWELNLSPSGDWNVYSLSGYRQGLQAETTVSALPMAQRRQVQPGGAELLELELELALPPLAAAAEAGVELSATTVLEHQQLGCSYWAWSHCGKEADFHQRASFRRL